MAGTYALRETRFQFGNLDPARIAAESGAIAVHGLALLLLLAPLSPPPPAATRDHPPTIYFPLEAKKNPPPIEPPKPDVVRPRIVPVTPAATPAKIDVPPLPLVDPQPGDTFIDASEEVVADAGAGRGDAIIAPLEGAHLQYEIAPPPSYPVIAIRENLTGTVILRVLVDIDGKPIDVRIERSSGHRALDAAARKQVLAKWRFRPAIQDGRAVQAIGMVPVVFDLQQ